MIYLFFGEDIYSIRQKVNLWINEFIKKYSDTNLMIFEDEINYDEFRTAVMSMPFLSEKRFVIAKNILQTDPELKNEIGKMLQEAPDFCILLFVEETNVGKTDLIFKRIQKLGKIEEFPVLTGSNLISWIFKKCKELRGIIENNAALFLSELIGSDLYRMENELHKLINFAKNRVITKEDVEILVNTTLDTSIFRLTNAIGEKDTKTSLALLHQLLESGEDLHRIFFMIVRQFRLLMQVKSFEGTGLRKYAVASKIQEKPYPTSIVMSQVANFSEEQLKNIYQKLLDIDRKVKTTGIKEQDFVLLVDKFIIDSCRQFVCRD